jgi:hypothetical protein
VAVLGYDGTGGQINGALAVLDLPARAQPPSTPGQSITTTVTTVAKEHQGRHTDGGVSGRR